MGITLTSEFVPLTDFVEQHSQRYAAEAVGLTPGAIWQMLENKRKVFICERNGAFSAYELKQVGRPIPEAANDDVWLCPCGK